METNPSLGAASARTLFAAKLSALADGKPVTEAIPAKKRGHFLTRRFFGGKDKPSAGQSVDDPTAAEPQGAAVTTPDTDNTALHADKETVDNSHPAAADAPAELPDSPVPSATIPPEPRITVPSFQHPPTTMTPSQPTIPTPAGRASAQLTLGFEITSLQLSPFFRLAAVQLKSLSNVVSLGLVAAGQTDQPLAAGISFGIERVELDGNSHLKRLLLKPLGETREAAQPVSKLQVESVAIAGESEDAPISVTTSGAASTVVQLVGTFAIAAIEFSPAFEIDLLRLEPASNTVLLRVAPSSGSDARSLPSSFEIAELQLDEDARIRGARLVPSVGGNP